MASRYPTDLVVRRSADGGQSLELPFRPQAGLVCPVVEGSVLY
jgi:hypothetical protein